MAIKYCQILLSALELCENLLSHLPERADDLKVHQPTREEESTERQTEASSKFPHLPVSNKIDKAVICKAA